MLTDNVTQFQISQKACEWERSIRNRIGITIRDLQFKVVADKGLIIKGQAASYFARQTAQEVVMAMTTLPIISNDIRVS